MPEQVGNAHKATREEAVAEIARRIKSHSDILVRVTSGVEAGGVGACIYTDATGAPHCYQLTPGDCALMGGTYVGGSCK